MVVPCFFCSFFLFFTRLPYRGRLSLPAPPTRSSFRSFVHRPDRLTDPPALPNQPPPPTPLVVVVRRRRRPGQLLRPRSPLPVRVRLPSSRRGVAVVVAVVVAVAVAAGVARFSPR